jgi:hypothetical protein
MPSTRKLSLSPAPEADSINLAVMRVSFLSGASAFVELATVNNTLEQLFKCGYGR